MFEESGSEGVAFVLDLSEQKRAERATGRRSLAESAGGVGPRDARDDAGGADRLDRS